MRITWLGHGTFLFQWGSGKTLIADPWIEGNPKYPKDFDLPALDLIVVSHGHFDHIHDAIPLARKSSPHVAGIFECCKWLESKGVQNTSPMNKGGTQYFFDGVDRISITMTHAVHSCGIQDGDQLIYGGEAAGYVFGFADGRSIYFAGDTGVFSDMQLIGELYRPDVAIIPVGDRFTMGPREAAKACALLNARHGEPTRFIPMHYGTFPLLTGTPEATGVPMWTLEPGKTVEW